MCRHNDACRTGLEVGLLGNRIPAGRGQIIRCCFWIAIVEWDKDSAFTISDAPCGYLNRTPPPLPANQIAVGDIETSSIRWGKLNPGLRCCRVQLRRPAGLGSSVEVVDG